MSQPEKERELLLKDKVVLVTGGSGGIGRAIVRQLSRAGADVIVHYRSNKEDAEALVEELKDKGKTAHALQAELTKDDDCRELFAKAREHSGYISLLVNNAAVQTLAPFMEVNSSKLEEMLTANLNAPFHIIQHFVNQLPQDKPGSVVNIGSIEGGIPAKGHSHYSVSKSALEMLTRASALELGARNIRVNTVSPGLINRDGLEQDWPDGVNRWNAVAPLGRLGEGDDVANAVLFLLSDKAAWITGQNLVVDGGMSISPAW